MITAVARQALTETEISFKELIVGINTESKSSNATPLYKLIVKKGVDFLVPLAIRDNYIDEICTQSQFDSHWQNAWRQLGLNPSELSESNEDPFHENLPIVTVSCLDLLKGDYIYQQYRSLIETQKMTSEVYEQAKAYLEEAADYGYFFALNALCINGLKQLKEVTGPDIRRAIANKILMYATKASELYFTPGYLLLSNVWQELHLYAQDMYPNAFDDKILKKSFFMNALIALHAAKNLEKISSAMINNAYQGKSIWKACGGRLTSWLQASVRLQTMSGQLLTLKDMDEAVREGNLIVGNLNKAYNFTEIESPQKSETPAYPDKEGRKSPTI